MNKQEKKAESRHQHYILVIDDEAEICRIIETVLSRDGHQVFVAYTAAEAASLMKTHSFDLVLADVCLPDSDGTAILDTINKKDSDVPVIIITAYASISAAVEFVKAGACDYIEKPFNNEKLRLSVNRILKQRDIIRENIALKRKLSDSFLPNRIIGESAPIKRIFHLIGKIKDNWSTVLIQGETGTGKELIARSLATLGPFEAAPFIAINCGAVPETLMESELFGHHKGAFTGAVDNKQGLVEAADGGILFLDEITEMSPALQVQFLRLLQDGAYRRVGEVKNRTVKIRVIAASNKSMEEMVEKGSFREDLFYRLNVISISMPPLRERGGDIRLLADYFLEQHCHKLGKRLDGFSPDVMNAFMSYRWPGNVRELDNVVHGAVLLTESSVIRLCDLPERIQKKSGYQVPVEVSDPSTDSLLPYHEAKKATLCSFERAYIHSLLSTHSGNVEQSARAAGINKVTLYSLIKKHGIDLAGLRK